MVAHFGGIELFLVPIMILLIVLVSYLYLRLKGIGKSVGVLRKLVNDDRTKSVLESGHFIERQCTLGEIVKILHTNEEQVLDKIRCILAELKKSKNEKISLENRLTKLKALELQNLPHSRFNKYNVICHKLEGWDYEELIEVFRHIVEKENNLALLINSGKRPTFVIGASETLIDAGFNSAQIAERLIESFSGKGGGDTRFASGTIDMIDDPENILKEGKELIELELDEIERNRENGRNSS